MKSLLVIGGSYFAGRVFVECLSALARYRVYLFNRGHLRVDIQGVSQITGDRERPQDIAERIPQRHWDVVVDFCAYTPEHIQSLLSRLSGSVGHYLFISTTSIYAPATLLPIPETAPKVQAPQPELGDYADYGYQKWLAECHLEAICREKAIPYTILRPAIIYGRYNYAPRESFFFDHLLSGTPLVVPENRQFYYSFIWVEDLAEMLIACLENPLVMNQAFNVASEERISYAQIADTIEEVTGRRFERRPMGTAEIIRQGVPMPFPPDAHLLYDGRKLCQALGFVPTPFILGMAKTWQDYQEVIRRRMQMQKEKSP
ncbi:Sugar dehydratase [Desulfosarcina cetonica]|uniref:NAD-dependent epimerase/dehydratase family protein n=1 Tax=Desulfosarcina cetonica TaxID=90730 RepID=UPI0006D047F7|nr:NAD-dependent epimerase/dehydratase family protein [Desulfosarcina cetonica]VTR65964.1 Sugar dehydratase [Desulfosarcina cetonica]